MRLSAHETAAYFLAQAQPPPDPGGQGEDFGKSSPVGLVLLILFAIAVAFLIRSMSKHLRKLPTSFDEAKAAAAAPARAQRAEAARERQAAESGAEEAAAAEDERGSAESSTVEPEETGEAERESGSAQAR